MNFNPIEDFNPSISHTRRGPHFVVEIKHWIFENGFIAADLGLPHISNKFNVYAHVFPGHPLYESLVASIKPGDISRHRLGELMHAGASSSFIREKAATIGADYAHDMDQYEQRDEIPGKVIGDARLLFNELSRFEDPVEAAAFLNREDE